MELSNQTLCVPRPSPATKNSKGEEQNLHRAVIARSTITKESITSLSTTGPIIILRVERFGFSANNVTYGALGEHPHFRYFDFHAAPTSGKVAPESHGVIPVWGYGTVIISTHPQIKTGERVFGYLGMSKYLVLPVAEKDLNKYNFYIPRPHLPQDRRPYNQITRCAADPLYDPSREDELMIFRPLFWTSFWCEDWLHTSGYFQYSSAAGSKTGANVIFISSASAKTAYCVAFVVGLRRRFGSVHMPPGVSWDKASTEEERKKIRIVGLTSKRNLDFTKSLGLYDKVYTYEEVEALDLGSDRWAYVDVAGNNELNGRVLKKLGSQMVKGVSLGMSHPSSAPGGAIEGKGQTIADQSDLEMFFMPEWLIQRREKLSVKEISSMQAASWNALMRSCRLWIHIQRIWANGGIEEGGSVLQKYGECVDGDVGPNVGLIFSLWNADREWEDEEDIVAKL